MGSHEPALRRRSPRRKSLALLAIGLGVYLAWPAGALARALVRFVHAVPGVGTAVVEITSGSTTVNAGSIGFGQATGFHSVRSGQFLWRLVGSGGKALANGSATVRDGSYTAVVLARTQGVMLHLYRDTPGAPGRSLIRVIHAAPELGSPELTFDSQIVDPRLEFTAATPYLSVGPGVHSFAAMYSGQPAPFLSGRVKLVNDISYSAIVVGSRGQRVRVVTVTDRGAPLTRPGPSTPAPASPHSIPANTGSGWITVAPGDSLWAIARRRLGTAASNGNVQRLVVAIWDANASRIGTRDPNLIFPGQRLHVPAK